MPVSADRNINFSDKRKKTTHLVQQEIIDYTFANNW